jgi:hypothetical protein
MVGQVDLLYSVENMLLHMEVEHIEPEVIFIIGAPRTGSTFFYQLLISSFDLPYISNLINSRFAEMPIVGFVLQRELQESIVFESHFGKTKGLMQPSEGSSVMSLWFGGGHPSQTVSSTFLPGKQEHFIRTIAAIKSMFRAPLIIKNPWNCFRIKSIAKINRSAKFIWIKRDIRVAALSDLEARYKTKGNPSVWNSATPSNVEELLKLHYTEQVVENQYEFNAAISEDLNALPPSRWCEVWYEDLLSEQRDTLQRLAVFLERTPNPNIKNERDSIQRNSRFVMPGDSSAITDYVERNSPRFRQLLFEV